MKIQSKYPLPLSEDPLMNRKTAADLPPPPSFGDTEEISDLPPAPPSQDAAPRLEHMPPSPSSPR